MGRDRHPERRAEPDRKPDKKDEPKKDNNNNRPEAKGTLVMPWWGWLIAIGGSTAVLWCVVVLVLFVSTWRTIVKKDW